MITFLIPYINENAEQGDIVWTEPWSHDIMVYYQLEGRLRSDLYIAAAQYSESIFEPVKTLLPGTTHHTVDWIIFQHRQTYYGAMIELDPITPEWLESRSSVFQLEYRGVPLMSLFKQ